MTKASKEYRVDAGGDLFIYPCGDKPFPNIRQGQTVHGVRSRFWTDRECLSWAAVTHCNQSLYGKNHRGMATKKAINCLECLAKI